MDRTWKLLEKKCMLIVSCQDESEGRAKGDARCFGGTLRRWWGQGYWEGKHNIWGPV